MASAIDHNKAIGLNGGVTTAALPSAAAPALNTAGTTPKTPSASHEPEPSDGEDAPPSSTMSPSSVHSPVYWPNSGGGHQRSTSSVSVESVLPAGAIMLRDNETSDHDDRNNACWARGVEVFDHTVVNGSATNIGAFVVWIIKVETLSGSFMNIRKRYSEFDEFRERLVKSFPNSEAAVPPLPPKSVISKFRPRFLERRRAGLQYFLNCILLNPEFSGSPVLKEFLFA